MNSWQRIGLGPQPTREASILDFRSRYNRDPQVTVETVHGWISPDLYPYGDLTEIMFFDAVLPALAVHKINWINAYSIGLNVKLTMDQPTLTSKTKGLEKVLQDHFDSLLVHGADPQKISIAKQHLQTASMWAVDAIWIDILKILMNIIHYDIVSIILGYL